MNWLAVLSLTITVYGLLVIWMMTRGSRLTHQRLDKVDLTILIAAKDEAQNLPNLLSALTSHIDRVIVIDDHSSDETASIAKASGAKLIVNEGQGKKDALHTGMKAAKGDTLLFLDADVILAHDWIDRAEQYILNHEASVWIFPVHMTKPNNWVNGLDALDFLSLIATTRAFTHAKHPIMANGACLAVNKRFYEEAIPNLRPDIPSGDDTFLVQYATQQNEKVYFVEDNALAVQVEPASSFTALLKQRIRWGQKTPAYTSWPAKLTAVIVLLANLVAVISFFAGWFKPLLWAPFIGKLLFDLIFLISATAEFEQQHLRRHLPLTLVIYPFYLILVGFGGFFVKPSWKDPGTIKHLNH